MDSVEKRSNMDEYARLLDRPLNTWPDTEAGRPKKEQQQSFLGRIFPTSASSALTVVAHGTTPFITTFLLIHLSAPVAAIGGGSSLASQVMLLGREYYQTPLGEKFLVILPIFAHIGASVGKRLLAATPSHTPSDSPSPEDKLRSLPPRPLSSLLSWTGYVSMCFLLPFHYPLHRIAPHSEAANAFGPSQLDMEYVKAGLQRWPVRSWILYGVLAGATLVHAADGLFVIARQQQLLHVKRRNAWRAAGVLATVPILAGTYVIWKEPSVAFSGLVDNFYAAFQQAHVYRF